jgi:hypothetical protein
MKRLATVVAAGYVGFALLGHLAERIGRLRCPCLPDCWCKRPGLSVFRWAFPYRHSLPEEIAES